MDTHIASSMEEAMPSGLDFCVKRFVRWAGLCPVDGQKKNGPASELAKPFCPSPSLPWQRPIPKISPISQLRPLVPPYSSEGGLPAVQELIWFSLVIHPAHLSRRSLCVGRIGGITIVTSFSSHASGKTLARSSGFALLAGYSHASSCLSRILLLGMKRGK